MSPGRRPETARTTRPDPRPAAPDLAAPDLVSTTTPAAPAADRAGPAPTGLVAVLTGQGAAFPPAFDQRAVWDGRFAEHYRHDRVSRRLFLGCGVTTRHSVVDPMALDVSDWTTGERMRQYATDAFPLARDALAAALRDAGLAAADLGLLVVVSCTGYGTPGLDIRLAAELGLAPDVRRLVVGHMGCYAAIPGLGAATDFVRARGRPAAVVCVELPSLHLQPRPAGRDLEQVVAHGLFGDAAAAVVIEPDAAHGFAVLDTTAATVEATSSLMTWEITDRGFRMGLSPEVPNVLARHVADVTGGLLRSHGRRLGDVAGWAVHPGGPRVVDVVTEQLGLPASATAATRAVLDQHGNCSSGTVLLVLAALRDGLRPGDDVVAMAFGPGLTLCSALLQRR